MGKTANARAWAEYERQQNLKQDEYFEPTEMLSEAERAAEFADFYFDRLDREADLYERVQ